MSVPKMKDRIYDLNLPNGNDLRQYGHFLLDGELSIKSHEDQKTKNRYAFIFETIMILVKASKTGDNGQYSFLDSFNLSEYKVESYLVDELWVVILAIHYCWHVNLNPPHSRYI